ncbi:VOC family protein [Streptomyces sp. NPDC004838]
MSLIIHTAFLPHLDPEASLTFYRDLLGFEVRNDVGYEDMRWITVGPPDQPDVSIVLSPPAVDPTISDRERETILELMAKGNYAALTLASDDLDAMFGRLEAADVEIMQEPIDQDYGVRDCAVRDPAGNTIRINQRS